MKTQVSQMKQLIKIVRPREKHWVGDGFYVSTVFSMNSEDNHHISPFLLLDHAAPKEFAPTDKKLGVGEHPHRGFETVTFAIHGGVDHRDSAGGGGTIQAGGVQWMTAGSGVVHEEFHSREFAKAGGVFEMVQLWVNLPTKHKMTSPRYQSMKMEQFPLVQLPRGIGELKIVAGSYMGEKGPAKTFSPINMYQVFIHDAGVLPLDFSQETNTLIVQLKGLSKIANEDLNSGEVAIFSRHGSGLEIKVEAGAHFLVLNGEPIDEPVVNYGPFVMNTRAQIIEAIDDYQSGKMGQLVEEA